MKFNMLKPKLKTKTKPSCEYCGVVLQSYDAADKICNKCAEHRDEDAKAEYFDMFLRD